MSRSRPLVDLRTAEGTLATMEDDAARARRAGRGAVGVVGRFELGPMADALRASGLGWYPLVALAVLGGVDALFAAALVGAGAPISYSLGIPNLALLVYIRILALVGSGLVVLRVIRRRPHRARWVRVGAGLAAVGLLAAGVARNPWALVGATALAGLGSGVAYTLHRPLLFDHYRPEVRVRALSAYGVGVMAGLAAASAAIPLIDDLGLTWRSVLLVLAALAAIGAVAAGHLSDPGAAVWETRTISGLVQRQIGAPGSEPDGTEERGLDLTIGERLRQVLTTTAAPPLLFAASGFGVLLVSMPPYLFLFWRDHWGMGPDAGVGLFSALCLAAIAGLAWFARRGELSFRASPPRMLRTAGRVTTLGAVCLPVATAVRSFPVMIGLLALAFGSLAVLLTASSAALLSVVRPTNRPHASLALGVAVLQGGLTGNFLMQGFASRFGLRWAFLVLGLYVLGAGASATRAGRTVEADLDDTVGALIEETELRTRVSQGQHLPLLGVRHVDFSYGPVQVLFDVTFTVDDGEMVALLGTNGAGKSTLLRLISGISLPARGSIHFRGSDVTHLGPDERVRLGITQVPGGRAVFGPMTVVENLRVFGYTHGRDRRAVEAGVDAGLAAFPRLAAKADHLAATLSGGEQQMVGLARAFVVRPRVLLIDELSLGLAPVVVGELLDTVRRINAEGTAVVIVEQSVNIALALVDHAYFMEKGQIRFDGPAAELAGRPDLLRSVFLEGAAAGVALARVALMVLALNVSGPVVALGAITGMVYGILAVGLVLVYRSTRVINFAHGQIGAFGAALLGVAVVSWHVPYWLAFPGALAVSAAVGSGAEVVVVRRLRNAPVIMTVIATLGLSQFLAFFSVVVNSQAQAGQNYPQPSGLPHFGLGALQVTSAHFAILVLTPMVVAALVVFLRRGRTGLAMRAVAANPDAAGMSGILSNRMSSLSWAVAGGVSAYTAILVLPTRGFTNAQFLGPGLLLRALVPAVIARMTNLPVALAAGVGLGVVEQVLLASYPNGGLVEAVLFVAILVTLLLQRSRRGRTEDKGTWAAVQAWPPLPESYQRVFVLRNAGRLLAALLVAVALFVPALVSNETAAILTFIMAFSLVGLSLGVITGLAGQLSLGQFGLAGVGAVASFVVTERTHDMVTGLLAAGLAAAAVSLVIGLPALRIRGMMLAVTTLGFALAAQSWLFTQSWMLGTGVHPGAAQLFGVVFDTGRTYYFLALGVFLAGLWLARNVWKGGLGRCLRAIRDNDDAARSFTVPAVARTLQGFVVAGFLAGLGGAVYGHAISLLSAGSFPVDSSINAAAATVVGGIGALIGPLLGSFYIIGLPRFVPLDNAGLAATSLGWLILLLQLPGGIAQGLRPMRDAIVDAIARRAGLDPVVERSARPQTVTRAQPPVPAAPRPRPPGADVILSASDLVKRYGGLTAVKDVTLAVRAGETVGLIGPNGAGKTTLFEVLSGFTRPDSGSITLNGADITGLTPEARGRLGLIRSFQDAALFPTLTVLDAAMLAMERSDPTSFTASLTGSIRPERRKAARAYELVASMGLYNYRNTQIRELSTGTRRITELCCLMALEPSVLLLDEPSSGIAQRETEALGELLRRIKAELDLTLVVIEHDIPLIMGLADRLVAMEAGAIVVTGTPEEVRNDPRVIASYLGGDITAIERSGLVSAAVPTNGSRRAAKAPAAAGRSRGGSRR